MPAFLFSTGIEWIAGLHVGFDGVCDIWIHRYEVERQGSDKYGIIFVVSYVYENCVVACFLSILSISSTHGISRFDGVMLGYRSNVFLYLH